MDSPARGTRWPDSPCGGPGTTVARPGVRSAPFLSPSSTPAEAKDVPPAARAPLWALVPGSSRVSFSRCPSCLERGAGKHAEAASRRPGRCQPCARTGQCVAGSRKHERASGGAGPRGSDDVTQFLSWARLPSLESASTSDSLADSSAAAPGASASGRTPGRKQRTSFWQRGVPERRSDWAAQDRPPRSESGQGDGVHQAAGQGACFPSGVWGTVTSSEPREPRDQREGRNGEWHTTGTPHTPPRGLRRPRPGRCRPFQNALGTLRGDRPVRPPTSAHVPSDSTPSPVQRRGTNAGKHLPTSPQ